MSQDRGDLELIDDKRELLKLKQGLITEQESKLEFQEKPHIIKPTGWAAVENFLYHHKLHLSVAAFFVIVAAFFAYFTLTREKADITILFIADNEETSRFFTLQSAEVERAFETFTPDFDGNGKIHAECLFIDLTTNIGELARSADMIHGNRVKLFGEIQAGTSLLLIGNRQALEAIPGDEIPFEDFYITSMRVKGSAFESAGDFERVPVPDDLYIVVRRKSGVDFDKAVQVFENVKITG